jgi:hypothetical protein
MLAVALRKPVYVLGGSGGAAQAVGRLLGLDHSVVNVNHCLVGEAKSQIADMIREYANCFGVPGCDGLPLTLAELRDFLSDRSINTKSCSWNGLNLDENRRLFASPTSGNGPGVGEAVGLIVQGLSRLDWKDPAGH